MKRWLKYGAVATLWAALAVLSLFDVQVQVRTDDTILFRALYVNGTMYAPQAVALEKLAGIKPGFQFDVFWQGRSAFATNNVPAKNWWPMTICVDGLLHSDHPLGDCPAGYQTTAMLLYTDIVSGSLTGGENNKGAYLSLFTYSPGSAANLGQAAGAKVYLRPNGSSSAWSLYEVDNYRSLGVAKTYPRSQILRIQVQLGALNGATGSLDVRLSVNGAASVTCTAPGTPAGCNTILNGFYVQPGHFWFVDPVSGSDTTGVVDDISHPFRYAQNFNYGTTNTFTGIWAVTTPHGDAGLAPGDTIVLRSTGTYSDNVGYDGRFIRFGGADRFNGSAPNGSAGHGYFHITSYPGAAAANAPETFHYASPVAGRGGIMGSIGAHGYPNTPTWGQYVTVSNGWLEIQATAQNDAAPIGLQSGADFWRVVNNELGPWVLNGNAPTSGGVAGQCASCYIVGNYIHNIAASSSLENHGIYFSEASNAGVATTNATASWNWINTVGGVGIQFFTNYGGLQQTGTVNSNYIENTGKYGINFADETQSGTAINNIINYPGAYCLRVNTPTGTPAFIITHNTCYQATRWLVGANLVSVTNLTTGSIKIQFNNLVLARGRAVEAWVYIDSSGSNSALTCLRNLYFDELGVFTTVPSCDATGVYGDPKFTPASSTNTGSNFTVQAGSTALGLVTTAEPAAVPTDFYGWPRPVVGTGAPGGTKNDSGATQDVGT